jgi:plastocyanin
MASWVVDGSHALAGPGADLTGRSTIEERRVEIVILRRRLVTALVAILGAAVVVLPAVAGSETSPTIEAVNSGGGYYGESHAWSPAQATVSAGGVVTLSNHTTVEHGVRWVGGPETPSCSGDIPVGTTSATKGANWSGTCTFAKPGVYTFYCTVHGPEMTGTITVNASGTTTISQPPSPGGGSTAPSSNEPGPGTTPGSAGSSGSPLAGSPAAAVELGGSQRGKSVRGSVRVSQAGAGGRLEVDVLARGASLASAPRPARVQVGRLVRSSLRAGRATFTVTLNAKAEHALRVHGHLALTVKIVLTPTHGSAVTVTRSVVLHA